MALLEDSRVSIFRLHLADSNASSDIMERIENLARERQVEIHRHSRQELARISKNARQDQGVAIDVQTIGYQRVEELAEVSGSGTTNADNGFKEVIVLDGVTNPQNLGLIIRSVTASPMTGLVLPRKGCARIDPLVHKASAGTLLRANIFHCPHIEAGLECLQHQGFEIIGMTNDAADETTRSFHRLAPATRHRAYVLGNETDGMSQQIRRRCDILARIPMSRGVDSINVAAAATLIAFKGLFA